MESLLESFQEKNRSQLCFAFFSFVKHYTYTHTKTLFVGRNHVSLYTLTVRLVKLDVPEKKKAFTSQFFLTRNGYKRNDEAASSTIFLTQRTISYFLLDKIKSKKFVDQSKTKRNKVGLLVERVVSCFLPLGYLFCLIGILRKVNFHNKQKHAVDYVSLFNRRKILQVLFALSYTPSKVFTICLDIFDIPFVSCLFVYLVGCNCGTLLHGCNFSFQLILLYKCFYQ